MARGARRAAPRHAAALSAGALVLCAASVSRAASVGAGFTAPSTLRGALAATRPAAGLGLQPANGAAPPRASRLPRTASLEEFASGALVALAGLAGAAWLKGALERQQEQGKYEAAEREEAAAIEERRKRAWIEPRKEPWTEAQLRQYDGSRDEDGPILIAVDGQVLNVWQGRHFYAPGGEYHIFAGRDATRLLAKGILEEESPEEAAQPLNIGEQAQLQTWAFTLKAKYQVVGTLAPSPELGGDGDKAKSGVVGVVDA